MLAPLKKAVEELPAIEDAHTKYHVGPPLKHSLSSFGTKEELRQALNVAFSHARWNPHFTPLAFVSELHQSINNLLGTNQHVFWSV